MKKNSLILISGVSAAAASAAVIAAVWGSTLAAGSETPDFTGLHDAQQRPAVRGDALPDMLAGSDNAKEFSTETSRFLGESKFAQYWSVLQTDGDLCIIVAPTASEAISGSCTSAESFAARGLVLSIQDPARPETAFAVYLLPDTARDSDIPTWTSSVSDTLIEAGGINDGASAFTVATSGKAVELRAIGAVQ